MRLRSSSVFGHLALGLGAVAACTYDFSAFEIDVGGGDASVSNGGSASGGTAGGTGGALAGGGGGALASGGGGAFPTGGRSAVGGSAGGGGRGGVGGVPEAGTGGMPPDGGGCAAIYGSVVGYLPCGETAQQCRFGYASNAPLTCATICADAGGTCTAADNGDPGSCVAVGAATCTTAFTDAICLCSLP